MSSPRIRWKFVLLTTVLSLLVAWVLIIGGISYFYTFSLLHPPCPATPAKRTGYESITLTTGDGAQLKGWWKPPQHGGVMLLLAGNGGNRDAMLAEAALFSRHGYGVVLLEYRSCAGGITTLGYQEVDDLRAMLDFALAQPHVEWVGVLGFSVGGATAIRGAAEMPEIEAVIAQGNFANFLGEITASYSPPLAVQWQIQQFTVLFYWLQTGIYPSVISPIDDIRRIAPRPVLLIHGENEVNRTRGRDQYAAAGEPRQIWVVPGVGHGGYLAAHPEEYERRVIEFLAAARR